MSSTSRRALAWRRFCRCCTKRSRDPKQAVSRCFGVCEPKRICSGKTSWRRSAANIRALHHTSFCRSPKAFGASAVVSFPSCRSATDAATSDFYLCGNGQMIEECKAALMARGVERKNRSAPKHFLTDCPCDTSSSPIFRRDLPRRDPQGTDPAQGAHSPFPLAGLSIFGNRLKAADSLALCALRQNLGS